MSRQQLWAIPLFSVLIISCRVSDVTAVTNTPGKFELWDSPSGWGVPTGAGWKVIDSGCLEFKPDKSVIRRFYYSTGLTMTLEADTVAYSVRATGLYVEDPNGKWGVRGERFLATSADTLFTIDMALRNEGDPVTKTLVYKRSDCTLYGIPY